MDLMTGHINYIHIRLAHTNIMQPKRASHVTAIKARTLTTSHQNLPPAYTNITCFKVTG